MFTDRVDGPGYAARALHPRIGYPFQMRAQRHLRRSRAERDRKSRPSDHIGLMDQRAEVVVAVVELPERTVSLDTTRLHQQDSVA